MSRSLPFTLYTKKSKMIWLLLACSAFTAAGVWMLIEGEWIGGLCGGFFALGIPIFLLQLHPKATFLTVSEDGLEFSALFRKSRISWTDISEFGTYTLRHNGLPAGTFVGINFSAEYRPAAKARAIAKALTGFEGGLPDTYGLSAQDLAQLLTSFHADRGRRKVLTLLA